MTNPGSSVSKGLQARSARPIAGLRDYLRLLGEGPLRALILIKFLAYLGLCAWGLTLLLGGDSARQYALGSTLATLGFVGACAVYTIYIMLALHNRTLRQAAAPTQ